MVDSHTHFLLQLFNLTPPALLRNLFSWFLMPEPPNCSGFKTTILLQSPAKPGRAQPSSKAIKENKMWTLLLYFPMHKVPLLFPSCGKVGFSWASQLSKPMLSCSTLRSSKALSVCMGGGSKINTWPLPEALPSAIIGLFLFTFQNTQTVTFEFIHSAIFYYILFLNLLSIEDWTPGLSCSKNTLCPSSVLSPGACFP